MADDATPSRREKLRAVRELATYQPSTTAGIVGASLLLAAMEGIGIGFVLPLVAVLQSDGEPSGPAGVFVDAYALVGLPFTLEFVLGGVAVVVGIRYTVGVVVAWLTARLRADYLRHLRVTAYRRLLAARTAYFDETGPEELVNALVTETGYASRTITRVVRGVKTALVATAYAFVAFAVAPRLGLLTAAILGTAAVAGRTLFESGYDVGERLADANERVQAAVQAGIGGIREVKLFGLDEEFRDRFRRAVDDHRRASIRRRRDQTTLANLNQFVAALTVFGLVYLGVTVSALSLPSLGVFLFAVFRLAPRVSTLSGVAYDVHNDLPHLVRTRSLLDRLAAERESWGTEPIPAPVDRVAVRNVTFGYRTGETAAVRDISCVIERGEFVALVGPSGAGKSTLASLLAGLYRPDEGSVTADGTPLDRATVEAWRSRVAVVEQDPHLFDETLRANLTIGNRDASPARIRRVCEIAQVTEFLDDLPEGLDTVIGDDGVRLSGGQRQRVALARALATDADLLVLDEATSELDGELESRVHAGLAEIDREYAVVCVAHRLATVTDADRIHVLDDGRIVETGTHEELTSAGGAYAALYDAQIDPAVSE